MTQPQTDRLVEDYLGAVSYACADLPPERRADLLTDLREHIEAARAVLYQPTEAAVRTILDRLGEPSVIADEARLGEPSSRHTVGSTEVSRTPSATLVVVLGFVLVIIAMLALGTVLTLWNR